MNARNSGYNRIRYILCFVVLPLIMLAAARVLDGSPVMLGPDARLYLSVADNYLATGHFIQNVRETGSYVVPFGVPLILTLLRSLSFSVGAILAVEYLLFGFSCLCLSGAEKDLGSSGFLAPVLYTLLFIRTDCLLNNIFIEDFFLPCLCALIRLLTIREMSDGKRLLWLNIFGFSCFAMRPVMIVVYLPVLGYTVYAAVKRRVSVLPAVLALLLPCLIMAGNAEINRRETGYRIFTENYSGADLYIANNPKARTTFFSAHELNEQIDETYYAVLDDPALDPTLKNQRLGSLARRWVLDNPGQYLKLCAGRFYSLFIAYWRGLLVIAFLGGIGTLRRRGRWRTLSIVLLCESLLLALLTSSGIIVGRYSLPLLPAASLHLSALMHWAVHRIAGEKGRPEDSPPHM